MDIPDVFPRNSPKQIQLFQRVLEAKARTLVIGMDIRFMASLVVQGCDDS